MTDALFATTPLAKHPAKYSDPVLEVLAQYIDPSMKVLDPFAGTGKIHQLDAHTVGIEIEPEWANYHERTIVGNALDLPFDNEIFDAVITSPTYGNRMADHHEAKDDSRRMTYRHQLGRPLTEGNSGVMQWGDEYRKFHIAAWKEVHRVLRPGGLFLLNISNHFRKFVEQPVAEWHLQHCLHNGFDLSYIRTVETPRLKFGENRDARSAYEFVFVMEKKVVYL